MYASERSERAPQKDEFLLLGESDIYVYLRLMKQIMMLIKDNSSYNCVALDSYSYYDRNTNQFL